MRHFFALSWSLLVLGLVSDQDDQEKKDGFKPLFDGKTFAGWKVSDKTPKSWNRGAGGHGDADPFFGINLTGSLQLFQAAFEAGVPRFVHISTCAVHDVILGDRPLDETHPLWPNSHYGAHKAALEAFVHSYGLGQGWPICALRPTGIYGLAQPPQDSRTAPPTASAR
jgi:nucleoside-diphosphate-sugar epimerase